MPDLLFQHGNAKNPRRMYMPNKFQTLEDAFKRVQHDKARNVYRAQVNELGEEAISNREAVNNQRRKHARENRIGSRNIVTDAFDLLGLVGKNTFLRHAAVSSEGRPSFVLYTDDMLKALLTFCNKKHPLSSIASVDKTYNIGNFFVTVMVFQHGFLLRQGTENHPIMFAGGFLHLDSTFETYKTFFGHLATKMAEKNVEVFGFQHEVDVTRMWEIARECNISLMVGSDEENALRNAMMSSFSPNSHYFLCCKHLSGRDFNPDI